MVSLNNLFHLFYLEFQYQGHKVGHGLCVINQICFVVGLCIKESIMTFDLKSRLDVPAILTYIVLKFQNSV